MHLKSTSADGESDVDESEGENNRKNDQSSTATTELRSVLDNFPHTKQVGAYLIGRTIGEGSFAKVKEGLHVLTGEKVSKGNGIAFATT